MTCTTCAVTEILADIRHVAEALMAAFIVLEDDPNEADLLWGDEEEEDFLEDDIADTTIDRTSTVKKYAQEDARIFKRRLKFAICDTNIELKSTGRAHELAPLIGGG
ncbi:hypothetical protein B0H10DRAFT_1948823 [Mycena sp. CBHHK59/15]|nr:hypothetical protein B0H10DRAFT_1948823 [Mycena sp. CBHHK59/15]